ncbi:MAG: acyl-CoA thioesterase domain-containing protein [Ferrimicrobium sp.]
MPPDHNGATGHSGVEPSSSGGDSYFFQLDDHRFRPLRPSQGPWNPEACHGGPPSALAIHELEQHMSSDTYRLAQVHIDFYGEVPLTPLTFATNTLRQVSVSSSSRRLRVPTITGLSLRVAVGIWPSPPVEVPRSSSH